MRSAAHLFLAPWYLHQPDTAPGCQVSAVCADPAFNISREAKPGLYFWSEGQSSQHSSAPFPGKAPCLSMLKKWTPFHTHIQFVLQNHWCHVSLWAPQPIPSISRCEDNYLELRVFGVFCVFGFCVWVVLCIVFGAFFLIDIYTFSNQLLEQDDRIKRSYRDTVSALCMNKE